MIAKPSTYPELRARIAAHRLRRKLSSSGALKLVVNVWGVGYGLCDKGLLTWRT